MRVAQQVEHRQFNRRYLHATRVGIVLCNAADDRVYVFAVVERYCRPASLDPGETLVADDLEFHDRLMRG